FSDVTASSGVGSALTGITGFTVRFCDMNQDRYPELLWIGDFGTTHYLRNNGNGTFTDLTNSAGVGLDGTEMGHAVADFDRDGDFDWYVTTINTNNLYRNNGNHSYTQIAEQAGPVSTGWGWATVAVDFNHDTLIDIAATSQSSGQYFYRNTSTALPTLSFFFNSAGFTSSNSGRGLANLDYDNDGDQDLVLFNYSGPVQLFRNNVAGAPDAHWLRIQLGHGNEPDLPPNGVGAVIHVTAGGISQMGRLDAGSNYQSQSELFAHFGLGTATLVDSILVEWPNGSSTVVLDVAADQTVFIEPGIPFLRGDVNDDAMVNVADIVGSAVAIFGLQAPKCYRSVDTNGDGLADITDVVFLAAHLFLGATPPPAPFPSCAVGPVNSLPCTDSACL
ncbi:MAG: FG-GAP-like repeat-containing protein, partial [Planctomycetota bacterium]